MMKKIVYFILISALVLAVVGWYKFLTPATFFVEKNKIIYIPTKATGQNELLALLKQDSVTSLPSFKWLASTLGYWGKIKPGRYQIKNGISVYNLLKQLSGGLQVPVDFVISRKIRQKQDFARIVGKNFECDSSSMMAFLNNNDSLQTLQLDSSNWYTAILHNTYSMPWTWPASKIFKKLYYEQQQFWKEKNRADKAEKIGLTPSQVYTLASIVAEETNKEEDKPNIASVYLNRLKMGMKLQADPTIKFAMQDFLLNRILFKHLLYPSPYNTYTNAGLPPGPICTVAANTIDAVLDAPTTDYIFFVAKADLRGGSAFSTNLQDHNKLAKTYQDSLTVFLKKKNMLAKIRDTANTKSQ